MSSASDRSASGIGRCAVLLAMAVACVVNERADSSPRGEDGEKASGATVTQSAVGPIPGTERRAHEPRNPLRDADGVLRDGRKLFVVMNCSGCHGGRAGGGMGPSLRDEVWLYGDSDGQIFDSIAQGRNFGMPAWGTQLPESEIWKLVAYVQSLRTPQEPDAPSP